MYNPLLLFAPPVGTYFKTLCHSFSFAVTCCTTHYYSLAFILTRYITRLSFHKRWYFLLWLANYPNFILFKLRLKRKHSPANVSFARLKFSEWRSTFGFILFETQGLYPSVFVTFYQEFIVIKVFVYRTCIARKHWKNLLLSKYFDFLDIIIVITIWINMISGSLLHCCHQILIVTRGLDWPELALSKFCLFTMKGNGENRRQFWPSLFSINVFVFSKDKMSWKQN